MAHPEEQYKQLIRDIIERGYYRPSPWKPLPGQTEPHPGTYSLMNYSMSFDLSEGWLPILTLRKLNFKPILGELLWFLSGSTNNDDLKALGVHVWDPWDTPETSGSLGYRNGELGPIYGAQWRDFGGRVYDESGNISYTAGYDQITKLVKNLQTSPNSKRHVVTTWHPQDMERCFVACCHGIFFCQVWGDRLHLHMVQRSGDVPVGIPFNITSYSLLLLMLAQVTGLKPGTFHHTISDAHVYENQLDAMKQLLEREPLPYPVVILNREVESIFDFTMNDFGLVGYQSHPAIKVPVAT